MTIVYDVSLQKTTGASSCHERCEECKAAVLAYYLIKTGFWADRIATRPSRCRYCYRQECPAAQSCRAQCTATPDQMPEPANRLTQFPWAPPPIVPPPDR